MRILCAYMVGRMPKPTGSKNKRTRIYLASDVIQRAKTHVDRNGFTLSGWVTLLVQKALGQKRDPRNKPV